MLRRILSVLMMSIWLIAGFVVVPSPAQADTTFTCGSNSSGTADLDYAFKSCLSKVSTTCHNQSQSLFWLLVGLEFILFSIRVMFEWRGEILTATGELVKLTLFIGFMSWALTNSDQIMGWIINYFEGGANNATTAMGLTTTGTPAGLLLTAGKICTNMFAVVQQISGWLDRVVAAVEMALASIAIMILMGFAASMMLVAVIETYLVTALGALLLGFGGMHLTKDLAITQFKYAVSVGVKFMTMQMICSIFLAMIQAMIPNGTAAATTNTTAYDLVILDLIGLILVFSAVLKEVPRLAQSVITGSSTANLNSLTQAVGAAAKGAAGAALGAMGLRTAVGAAQDASSATRARAASGLGGSSGAAGGVSRPPPVPPTAPASGPSGPSQGGGPSNSGGGGPGATRGSAAAASNSPSGGGGARQGGAPSSGPGGPAANAGSESPGGGRAEGQSGQGESSGSGSQLGGANDHGGTAQGSDTSSVGTGSGSGGRQSAGTVRRLGAGLSAAMTKNTLGGRMAAAIRSEAQAERRARGAPSDTGSGPVVAPKLNTGGRPDPE